MWRRFRSRSFLRLRPHVNEFQGYPLGWTACRHVCQWIDNRNDWVFNIFTSSMHSTSRIVDTVGNAFTRRDITSAVSLGIYSIENNRTFAPASDILLNKSRYPNSSGVLTSAKMRWVALETSLEMHLNSPRTSWSCWSALVDWSAQWALTRLHGPSVMSDILEWRLINWCNPSWGKFFVEKPVKFGKRRVENKRRHWAMESSWTSMESQIISWQYARKELSSTTLEDVNLATLILSILTLRLKAALFVAILLYVCISEVVVILI